jgi:hypothetical protein
LLTTIPKGHQPMVSAAFKTIFAQVSTCTPSGTRWQRPWRAASTRVPPS